MSEIGTVYAPPENSKLSGLTVKDSSTAGSTFFLYKCTVRDLNCEVRELTFDFLSIDSAALPWLVFIKQKNWCHDCYVCACVCVFVIGERRKRGKV